MLIKTILSIFLFGTIFTYAQVGIGTTNPDPGSALDINSTDKGILIPRVALTATNSQLPITPAAIEGMMVYNTATAGTSPNIVTPGFYFWDGTMWVKVATGGTVTKDWTVTGNGDTDATTDFIGTTNNQDLRFKTFDVERMRILNAGVVINTSSPLYTGDRFTVLGTAGEYAINGYSSTNGIGIYGENTGAGYGIYGYAPSNIGVIGIGVNGVQGQSSNATGFGTRAANTNATGTGLLATGTNSIGSFLTSGTGIASTGANGLFALGRNTTGTGIIGTGNNSTTIVTSANGGGIAGSGTRNGIFGYAGEGGVSTANRGNAGGIFILDADNNPTTITGNNGNRATAILAGFDNVQPLSTDTSRNSYFGGYFSGGSQSSGSPTYAYVGMRYRTNTNGDGVITTGTSSPGQDYKIIGTGLVSTLINDSQGTPRILFAPESPEIVFQDYGIGKLVNGQTRIELDPILKRSLQIDENNPLKVYVTLEGECNGVFVTNKTADGFTVKELQGGTSNVSFSWQIVANRADTKDNSGRVVSKHVGVRLPIGPGPLNVEATTLKTETIKENNTLNKENLINKQAYSTTKE